jgi:helix-turn-helix protein
MSDEKKIRDTQGKFLHAVRNGQDMLDAEWNNCRVVLTNKRVALIADGKRSIPLADIERFGGRVDVNQAAANVADYTALHADEDVVLVATPEHEAFETDLYNAILDGEILFVKHPAVEGGVVQDSGWQKARIKVTDEVIRLAVADGDRVEIERDDIGDAEEDERDVKGEKRLVVEVEHTDDEGISVETHVTGERKHASVLLKLVRKGFAQTEANIDLDPTEKRVIMALHSGVSSFAIPEFVGISVEQTEAIFDRLIELDVIEVVRERTEVEITPEGRSAASESMASQ